VEVAPTLRASSVGQAGRSFATPHRTVTRTRGSRAEPLGPGPCDRATCVPGAWVPSSWRAGAAIQERTTTSTEPSVPCLVVHRGDARQLARGMVPRRTARDGPPGDPSQSPLSACARCRVVLDCRPSRQTGSRRSRRGGGSQLAIAKLLMAHSPYPTAGLGRFRDRQCGQVPGRKLRDGSGELAVLCVDAIGSTKGAELTDPSATWPRDHNDGAMRLIRSASGAIKDYGPSLSVGGTFQR
jgi:hypothetical protein